MSAFFFVFFSNSIGFLKFSVRNDLQITVSIIILIIYDTDLSRHTVLFKIRPLRFITKTKGIIVITFIAFSE